MVGVTEYQIEYFKHLTIFSILFWYKDFKVLRYVKDWNTYYNGFLRADQSMAKHCCRMGWIGCPTLLTDEKQSWDFNILHIFAILALKRYGKILSNVGKTFCSVLHSNCLFQCNRSGYNFSDKFKKVSCFKKIWPFIIQKKICSGCILKFAISFLKHFFF